MESRSVRRDSTDEWLYRRTTAGFIGSFIIHALAALLFVAVVTSSSEQSSPESIEGSAVLSVSHVQVSRQTKSVPPVVHPPETHAPKIAKPLARPVLAGHRAVPTHRELAKQDKKAPPNPTPAPVAPFSPNPQQTQVAVSTPAPAQIASVPVDIPSARPIIAQKAVAPQPTAAPPTAPPSAKPSPAPVATQAPQPVKASPQPTAAPTQQPSKAPAAPVATAAPTRAPATEAPRTVVPSSPAPVHSAAGISSPAPTGAPSPSAQHGVSPTAGPKGQASPGQGPLPKSSAKPQPARPIAVPPTPAPATPSPRPQPAKTLSPKKQQAYSDLADRLRGLLPNGPVVPTTKRYSPGASGVGPITHPTPPPEVLARTKFLFDPPRPKYGASHMDRIIMWVTSVSKNGPLTICHGWLLDFPRPPAAYGTTAARSPLHGGAIVLDNPGPRPENNIMPRITADASVDCDAGQLKPFNPQAAPSPAP
ncbi:MAG: hypothetical protein NVSMB31_13820 [Vulcanimicrobiaceae bacterium]